LTTGVLIAAPTGLRSPQVSAAPPDPEEEVIIRPLPAIGGSGSGTFDNLNAAIDEQPFSGSIGTVGSKCRVLCGAPVEKAAEWQGFVDGFEPFRLEVLEILALWALLGLAGQTAERVLDLSRPANSELPSGFKYDRNCSGRTDGRLRKAPNLALAIERLDREEYALGGQLTADLILTNRGADPFVFPSVLAYEYGFGFEGPDAVEANLGISIVDASGREQPLTGTILRGASSRHGTTQLIAPGESIRIRFPTWITYADTPNAPITGDAQIFANIIMSDGDCATWQPVSSRRVNIRFRGRNGG
jgi:hypothetical protein